MTQGARVPKDLRGDLKGSLFVRDGVVQAIGVIAFAFVCRMYQILAEQALLTESRSQFPVDIRVAEEADYR